MIDAEKSGKIERIPVTIKLLPAVHQALRVVSGGQMRTISDVIEAALQEYLPKQQIPDEVQAVLGQK